MLSESAISTPWITLPAWFAIDPLAPEDEPNPAEDFVYHRPVLQREVLQLLEPKLGSLIVDGTCGGGGHTEALLERDADVVALDQDPDAIQHVTKRLERFGRRLIVRQANFRHAGSILTSLRSASSTVSFLISEFLRGNSKMRNVVLVSCEMGPSTCAWIRERGSPLRRL